MIILRRQQQSLDAYLKLLQNREMDREMLAHRRELLEKFLPVLAGKPAKGECYRNAVDECINLIDRNDWPLFLQCVREYYYFWNNDFKAIAALHKEGVLGDMRDILPAPDESFNRLWEKVDYEKFSMGEAWAVNAYRAVLLEDGLQKKVAETRVKMIKLLLVQLRKAEGRDGRVYRAAVDSMLPVFTKPEAIALFLEVIREFFHFWMGNPEAAQLYFSLKEAGLPNNGVHPGVDA